MPNFDRPFPSSDICLDADLETRTCGLPPGNAISMNLRESRRAMQWKNKNAILENGKREEIEEARKAHYVNMLRNLAPFLWYTLRAARAVMPAAGVCVGTSVTVT